jgi:hypothetical protein
VKEQVKQILAEHLLRKSHLKITLRNLQVIGSLAKDLENQILDEIIELDKSIRKMSDLLKTL